MAEIKPVTLCRLFRQATFVSLWLYEVAFTIIFNALLSNMYHLSLSLSFSLSLSLSLSERNTRARSPMVPAGATCYVRLQSGRVDSWPLRMRKWCCCAAATADVIFPMDHVENVHLYSSREFKGDCSLGMSIIWSVNRKAVALRLWPRSVCAECVNSPFSLLILCIYTDIKCFFAIIWGRCRGIFESVTCTCYIIVNHFKIFSCKHTLTMFWSKLYWNDKRATWKVRCDTPLTSFSITWMQALKLEAIQNKFILKPLKMIWYV